MIRYFIFLYIIVSATLISAQKPYQPNAAEIFDKIKKLNVLGTALYVGAHPDDENQRLITYLANQKGYHTSYISLTRGGGGQNEIGTEIRDDLGVLRTQELLGARSIDGGHQRFSRAVDFGYSKHPDETFEIWNKEAVLSDLVYTIRELQPDIIINRFDHRKPGATHGHHTGSAMLAVEAFDISNNQSVYPEHFKFVAPHKASAIFLNTHPWFYGGQEAFDKADKTNLYSVDIGVYYPLLGQSNSEISQLARSQHKCQGFGATGYRGTKDEWLEFLKGNRSNDKADPFSGINTTWSRVAGGKEIEKIIDDIIKNYSFTNPSQSVSELIRAYKLINSLDSDLWKKRKRSEIKEIVSNCIGLYLEIKADHYSAVPGDSVRLSIEAINRSDINVSVKSVEIFNKKSALNYLLKNNVRYEKEISLKSSDKSKYASPFWLVEPHGLGTYVVPQLDIRNQPVKANQQALFLIEIEGELFRIQKPIVNKWNDPVAGESYRPFGFTPPVSVSLADEVYIYQTMEEKNLKVLVQSWSDGFEGDVQLKTPKGWVVTPGRHPINLAQRGESMELTFSVKHTNQGASGQVSAIVNDASSLNTVYQDQIKVIKYDHIPTQTVIKKAAAEIVVVDLIKKGNLIGYIQGAGDKVSEAIQIMGYEVEQIDLESATLDILKNYDAVVLGVRAFNTEATLQYKNQLLFDYADQGGTVVVQYNKNRGLKTENIAPYPIKLSRKRVTNEHADVQFINPSHPVLNFPNKISLSDFDHWVQERGLYFPDSWDDKFTPIISCNDLGEDPLSGSLLVAQHGNGHYIYTSLSFFRELPAGVTGAYRLLANILSIGKE